MRIRGGKNKHQDKLAKELISFVSHQIKSPVSAIRGHADLIAEGHYGRVVSKVKDIAMRISNIADRCIDLVNNLLDLNLIEEGKMTYKFDVVRTKDLIRDIVDEMRFLAMKKGIRIIYREGQDFKIRCDRRKLHQALQNIIDNAIKYTDRGHVAIYAEELQKRSRRKTVAISILDTGRGIDPKIMPNIFDKFIRDAVANQEIKGTGLGLYIAKQIVDAHKGRIWAESGGRDKGSIFHIELAAIK